MLREYNPKFKPVPAPLIGFDCVASGGADVQVAYDEFFDQVVITIEHEVASSWSKVHLDEFITKLQEVSANYQKGGK